MNKKFDICIDFDGTIVKHAYPAIGEDIPYAIEVITWLQEQGHRLILWTMRDGDALEQAVKYLEDRSITLYGVNENPSQHWTSSPKAYAEIYIDDRGLGQPLTNKNGEIYVDWNNTFQFLTGQKYTDYLKNNNLVDPYEPKRDEEEAPLEFID